MGPGPMSAGDGERDEAPEYARPGENRLYALHAT